MGNKMSTVIFRHENHTTTRVKGVKTTVKEDIIDGEKGLFLKFLKKEGEKSFYKIAIREKEDARGKYEVSENKNDKETTSEVDEKGLVDLLKKNSDLGFGHEYVTKERKNRLAQAGKKRKAKKSKKRKSKKSK